MSLPFLFYGGDRVNICKSEQEFIQTVAPYAQKVCKTYGFYLPSVLIAQACKEVGYAIPSYWDNPGVRALVEESNMVGIKRDLLNPSWVDIGLSVWDGRYLNKKTPEVYDGVPVTVDADFRIYDNPEQSFADYLCFMRWGGYSVGNPKYYNDIKDVRDYKKLIQIVHQKGYATGPTYSSGVISIIQKHNLTKYDDLTGVEPSRYVPGVQAVINIIPNPNFEPYHNTSARPGKIEYIYIHYVGSDGDAEANIEYYNQLTTTDASADFYCGFVGDIRQYNMKLEQRYCWAVGGGRQSNFGGAFYGIAKNANGISIEMCVRNRTTKRKGSSDWNPNSPTWYLEPATINACVRLTIYLMQKYGISADHVIRHYDVNGKFCPGVVGWNDASGSDESWREFKQAIVNGSPAPVPTPQPVPIPDPSPALSRTIYRVQVGAYQKKGNADNRAVYVKDLTKYDRIENYKKPNHKVREGYDCFIERGADGVYRVFCGSFTVKANAENRSAELGSDRYKINNFIVEVKL